MKTPPPNDLRLVRLLSFLQLTSPKDHPDDIRFRVLRLGQVADKVLNDKEAHPEVVRIARSIVSSLDGSLELSQVHEMWRKPGFNVAVLEAALMGKEEIPSDAKMVEEVSDGR